MKGESELRKVYHVIHQYDVDGGFGDAIPQEDIVAIFSAKATAEDFVAKYMKPHVYEEDDYEF